MVATIKAAASYFAIVFVIAFALGDDFEFLLVAPRFGAVAAVSLEVPLLLAVSWVTASWSITTFTRAIGRSRSVHDGLRRIWNVDGRRVWPLDRAFRQTRFSILRKLRHVGRVSRASGPNCFRARARIPNAVRLSAVHIQHPDPFVPVYPEVSLSVAH